MNVLTIKIFFFGYKINFIKYFKIFRFSKYYFYFEWVWFSGLPIGVRINWVLKNSTFFNSLLIRVRTIANGSLWLILFRLLTSNDQDKGEFFGLHSSSLSFSDVFQIIVLTFNFVFWNMSIFPIIFLFKSYLLTSYIFYIII